MVYGELSSLISTFDTYIYPFLLLIIWNFITTKKVKNKVYGDGGDPTEKGLLVEVESLSERVTDLEHEQSNSDDRTDD